MDRLRVGREEVTILVTSGGTDGGELVMEVGMTPAAVADLASTHGIETAGEVA